MHCIGIGHMLSRTIEALRVVNGWASYWLATAGLVMRLATCIALLLVASMHAGGSC